MASVSQLWKLSSTANSTNLEMNAAGYIKSEMGIELRKLQDDNTIKAIATPATFIADRSAAIEALFHATTGVVTLAFQTKFAELQALHLPEDVCKSMAKASAARVYQEQLELLELKSPDGYAKSFGIASADHNNTLQKNAVANTGISELEEYKARKRSKKAAKRARKAAK